MIELIHHGTVFTPICDGCGRELPEEYDFDDALDAMRAAGWTSEKVAGQWENYCRECSLRFDFED